MRRLIIVSLIVFLCHLVASCDDLGMHVKPDSLHLSKEKQDACFYYNHNIQYCYVIIAGQVTEDFHRKDGERVLDGDWFQIKIPDNEKKLIVTVLENEDIPSRTMEIVAGWHGKDVTVTVTQEGTDESN